jgi:hypothetical protein
MFMGVVQILPPRQLSSLQAAFLVYIYYTGCGAVW